MSIPAHDPTFLPSFRKFKNFITLFDLTVFSWQLLRFNSRPSAFLVDWILSRATFGKDEPMLCVSKWIACCSKRRNFVLNFLWQIPYFCEWHSRHFLESAGASNHFFQHQHPHYHNVLLPKLNERRRSGNVQGWPGSAPCSANCGHSSNSESSRATKPSWKIQVCAELVITLPLGFITSFLCFQTCNFWWSLFPTSHVGNTTQLFGERKPRYSTLDRETDRVYLQFSFQ